MYQVEINKMRVVKRNGSYEEVSFDKILTRIKSLSQGQEFKESLNIDETIISQKVIQEIHDGVKTTELDELSSQISIAMYSKNPQFKTLAGRIVISNHHKNTLNTFSEKIELLYNYHKNGKHKPLVAKYLYDLVMLNKEKIDSSIDYMKDYDFDFFGFKTLEKSYLYKVDGKIIERPQDMLMRVSLAIHRNNLNEALVNYDLMSKHYFTHATPTLYNAGSNREQFASCFLLTMKEDSISGIYDTLKDCALISKHAGGIGLSIHDIRAKDSHIAGTNGVSNGLVPMLRVFNDTARYVDQGGGKRNGSFAMYLEPWHADIFEFIELKKNHGNELERARDLFYALWIPDLFMERVLSDGDWSLFCPNECPGLSDSWGKQFNSLYDKYTKEGKSRQTIKARELWSAILTSQIEVGTPYLLYKDACNRKSNQQNLGTIKSSNLCTEIIEYTSREETAVCNLASISLKKFVKKKNTKDLVFRVFSKPNCVYCELAKGLLNKMNIEYQTKDYRELTKLSEEYPLGVKFPQIYRIDSHKNEHIGGYTELNEYLKPSYDFIGLQAITERLTKNLNNIIDYNYYPTKETKTSNLRHRPIGIGVQGLANVFFEFGYAFDSEEAKDLNERIFECIYYGSLKASMNIAKSRENLMKIYKTYHEQFDGKGGDNFVSSDEFVKIKNLLTNVLPEELDRDEYLGSYSSFIGSPLYNGKLQFDLWSKNITDKNNDWTSLRRDIKLYGVRNSLLVAPMPTASTAQILGNYECFEPILSNIYTRRVLSGEYMVMNDYLVQDLISLGLWSSELKDKIIANDGSVLNIPEIPDILKNRYKTVWEIKQKNILDMAISRGKYICQSQSMNLFLESPNLKTMSNMHSYSWKNGLKTGIYYLRSRPSSKAIQFTLDPNACENCSA
ncbi:MAG: ribonucleoside-diphosphate reductase subunit alpha [Candidatus Marinimicrobia bacterium]|nr:ribonucleoside-diphosphate reductase subunit alpha [Candidatus Neomarinimicrobiota bacterium]